MQAESTLEVSDVDTELNPPESYEDVESLDEAIVLLDNRNEVCASDANEAFREVHDAAQSTLRPDDPIQLGRILPPVVSETPTYMVQTLAITIPVMLPDGETVKAYTCLYGENNPDENIDRMMELYANADKDITSLTGEQIPVVYTEDGWSLYLINRNTSVSESIQAVVSQKVSEWAIIAENSTAPLFKNIGELFYDLAVEDIVVDFGMQFDVLPKTKDQFKVISHDNIDELPALPDELSS